MDLHQDEKWQETRRDKTTTSRLETGIGIGIGTAIRIRMFCDLSWDTQGGMADNKESAEITIDI